MTKKITSLPDRPLTVPEMNQLVDSEKFAPLTIKSELLNELSYNADVSEENSDGDSVMLVYSLLHANDEKGYTIAYSEVYGHWVKVVEADSEDYDMKQIEQETHEFVKEHSDVDVDAGYFDVSDM